MILFHPDGREFFLPTINGRVVSYWIILSPFRKYGKRPNRYVTGLGFPNFMGVEC